METRRKLFEWKGYATAVVSFFFTLFMYYSYTDEFFYSFLAAICSSGVIWGTYIVIRMVILAIREK